MAKSEEPAASAPLPPPNLPPDELVNVLYQDLRQIAAGHLRTERPNHTLAPTALVHEAYLRMVKQHGAFADRRQFIALASAMMRRILVDHARARHADKRGGDRQRLTIAGHTGNDPIGAEAPALEASAAATEAIDLLALDQALARLAEISPEQARLVELRFFGGLSIEETAEVLKVSPGTVMRDWTFARAWLRNQMKPA